MKLVDGTLRRKDGFISTNVINVSRQPKVLHESCTFFFHV